MKKFSKVKRIFTILLIFLFSINSFATSVGDNDGSAFITKAEFDSLKNNFQTQIDAYNTGIDSKIDAAIASYLAGINIRKVYENTLFYPVNNLSATGRRYFIKEEDFQEQKNQMFNSVTIDFNLLGYNYLAQLKPYVHSGWSSGGVAQQDYDGWCFYNQTLRNLELGSGGPTTGVVAPNMESFVYDEENKDVLIEWWKKDILNISGQISFAGNSYGLRVADLAWNLIDNLLLNKRINETIIYPFVQTNTATYNAYFTQSQNTRFPSRNGTASSWKNFVPDSMLNPSNDSISGYYAKSSLTSYTQTTLGDSFLVTESKSNQDTNVYLYHHCDAKIYVHGATEQNMVQCTDFLPDDKRPLISKVTQIAVSDIEDEPIAYGKNTGRGTSLKTDAEQAHGVILPKVKLKNNSTYTDDSTGWTNLNKFKNGLLPYTDASGTIQYPKYYGGLPLYIENATAKKITIDIQIANDDPSIPWTNIWIKNGEFLNVADTRTWSATDKNKLKELAGDGCIWKDDFRMLSIPNNTKKTIEIKNVNPGDVLFLRFAQNGSFSCGELKYLGDCITELQD